MGMVVVMAEIQIIPQPFFCNNRETEQGFYYLKAARCSEPAYQGGIVIIEKYPLCIEL
jgi:hypothetical protein